MNLKITFTSILMLCLSFGALAQMTFSVSPGFGLNSANFGYQVNPKLVPFVGVQLISFGAQFEETGEEFNSDENRVKEYSYSSKYTANAIVPSIGAKYFLKNDEKVKSFVTLAIAKPMISGKGENDGEIDEDYEEALKNVDIIASEAGFGAEYFFSDQFSIGGEFGIRLARGKVTSEYDSEFYNPLISDYQTTTIESTYKVNLKPTYTRLSLNFYFSKK